MKQIALITLFSLLIATSATAQTPKTPPVGSKTRKDIFDALRIPVQKALNGKQVVFKVDWMKATDTWCFMKGVPLQPDGKPMDYKGTQFQQYIDQQVFDDWFCALLKKVDGKWIVKAWQIGATDVAWDAWYDTYKPPKALFPYPNN